MTIPLSDKCKEELKTEFKDYLKTDILLALIVSILYVSSMFIIFIIINKYNLTKTIIYSLFIAFLYGFVLLSKSRIIWLFKWGLSIPFTFPVLNYFWLTHYEIRSTNWIFPNYGRTTGGGGFAYSFVLLIYSVFCIISGLLSLIIKIKDYDRFRKIQFYISVGFCIVIVLIILLLQLQFPTYEQCLG